jgi:hypothetical protein
MGLLQKNFAIMEVDKETTQTTKTRRQQNKLDKKEHKE